MSREAAKPAMVERQRRRDRVERSRIGLGGNDPSIVATRKRRRRLLDDSDTEETEDDAREDNDVVLLRDDRQRHYGEDIGEDDEYDHEIVDLSVAASSETRGHDDNLDFAFSFDHSDLLSSSPSASQNGAKGGEMCNRQTEEQRLRGGRLIGKGGGGSPKEDKGHGSGRSGSSSSSSSSSCSSSAAAAAAPGAAVESPFSPVEVGRSFGSSSSSSSSSSDSGSAFWKAVRRQRFQADRQMARRLAREERRRLANEQSVLNERRREALVSLVGESMADRLQPRLRHTAQTHGNNRMHWYQSGRSSRRRGRNTKRQREGKGKGKKRRNRSPSSPPMRRGKQRMDGYDLINRPFSEIQAVRYVPELAEVTAAAALEAEGTGKGKRFTEEAAKGLKYSPLTATQRSGLLLAVLTQLPPSAASKDSVPEGWTWPLPLITKGNFLPGDALKECMSRMNRWRSQFEKAHPSPSLWEAITALLQDVDAAITLAKRDEFDRRMKSKKRKIGSLYEQKESSSSLPSSWSSTSCSSRSASLSSSLPSLAPTTERNPRINAWITLFRWLAKNDRLSIEHSACAHSDGTDREREKKRRKVMTNTKASKKEHGIELRLGACPKRNDNLGAGPSASAVAPPPTSSLNAPVSFALPSTTSSLSNSSSSLPLSSSSLRSSSSSDSEEIVMLDDEDGTVCLDLLYDDDDDDDDGNDEKKKTEGTMRNGEREKGRWGKTAFTQERENKETRADDNDNDYDDERKAKSILPCGVPASLVGHVREYLILWLAHMRNDLQASIEGIRSLDDEHDNDNDYDNDTNEREKEREREETKRKEKNSAKGIECGICCEQFSAENMLICQSETSNPHWYCKRCLRNYVNITLKGTETPSSIACPESKCKALLAPAHVRSFLTKWECMKMERREAQRNERVALRNADVKAVLRCTCGAVGVVDKTDVGNGIVECYGCKTTYCVHCGNEGHAGDCPPPRATLEWLDKFSKPCPQCGAMIQKNGGCDHMTCRRPLGCGYEFWYSCGCDFKKPHTCGKRTTEAGRAIAAVANHIHQQRRRRGML